MSFRDCVLSCIRDHQIILTFNRWHGLEVTATLLNKLASTADDSFGIRDLSNQEREMLASFLIFVHLHVWRKIQVAQERISSSRHDALSRAVATQAQTVA